MLLLSYREKGVMATEKEKQSHATDFSEFIGFDGNFSDLPGC